MTLLSPLYFIFCFIAVLLYYLSPMRMRVYVLAFVCVLFYLILGLLALFCMLGVSFISFFFALKTERSEGKDRYVFITVSVCVLLIILTGIREISKMTDIVIPIGISFYSLRAISYLVDVKSQSIRAERNFFEYLLYISFFPIAFLGPVVKLGTVKGTLLYPNKATWDNISGGILRVLCGVLKKTVVADALAEPVKRLVTTPEKYSGAYVLLLIALYSVEVYFDFSGGIDIALGSAMLFGVRLVENFNKPFSSKTVSDFWNRWHITLGEWFEHYVFYPLSLTGPMQRFSRFLRQRLGVGVGKRIPLYISTLVTWVLTGLWHGGASHYIAWGIINGILVLLSGEVSRLLLFVNKKHPTLSHLREKVSRLSPVRVFFVIGAVRLLDVYKSVPLTISMLASVFSDTGNYNQISDSLLELMPLHVLIPAALAVAATFIFSRLNITLEKICKRPYVFTTCAIIMLTVSLIFGNYGYGFKAEDFIYSQY